MSLTHLRIKFSPFTKDFRVWEKSLNSNLFIQLLLEATFTSQIDTFWVRVIPDSYFHSDRCRTTNNMLGDAYGAAVVEALSKKELEAMDLEMKKQLERERSDLESAQTDLKTKKVEN